MGGAPAGPMFFVKIGEGLSGKSVAAYGYERCLGEPMKLMARGMLGQAGPEDVVAALEGQAAHVCLAALGLSGVDPFCDLLAARLPEFVELSASRGALSAYGAWRAGLERQELDDSLGGDSSGKAASGRL
jgi:hypothetical protein